MSATGGGGGGEPSWAWLGLLKWSLAYSDGTVPSSESLKPMSEEDRKFLEEVMQNGIIDEAERMKTILADVTESLEVLRDQSSEDGKNEVQGAEETKRKELSVDETCDLLDELRDIVEQIDYARAFAALGGIPFLLGCASQRDVVPRPIRSSCLAVLATLCQNNPPVQMELLERGHIPVLVKIYFAEYPSKQPTDGGEGDEEEAHNAVLRNRAVQALSCSIRNHAVAEKVFCTNEAGVKMIESGLGLHAASETLPPPPASLRRRCLFFLRALATSDSADHARVELFRPAIQYAARYFIDAATGAEDDSGCGGDAELREMTVALLEQLLVRKKGGEMVVLDVKDEVGLVGVQRVSAIRALPEGSEERERASVELENWEGLLVELARAAKTMNHAAAAEEEEASGENLSDQPLLIENRAS